MAGDPVARRVAFTRARHALDYGQQPEHCDVIALVDFAEHMRDALARIGDRGMTLKEAKRIAKLARMGEGWKP